MAIEDIKQAIAEQAQKEIVEIETAGQQKIDEIKSGWNKKIEARKEEIIGITKLKAEQKIQQTSFKIKSKNQAEILDKKHQLINQVYKKVEDKLNELSPTDYIELMKKIINRLPETDGKLISAKGKQGLLKKALGKSDREYKLATETVNKSGGFIFHSGDIDIDNTFPILINDSREQTILEVCDILFPAEEQNN